jgi:hypothetical protein
MKKTFLTWLLVTGFASALQATQADKIDLLRVVDQNIEQYKINAMNEQQHGAATRSVHGKDRRLNKQAFFQRLITSIKNNKHLLGAFVATGLGLWALKFLMNQMPLDMQNSSFFGFDDNQFPSGFEALGENKDINNSDHNQAIIEHNTIITPAQGHALDQGSLVDDQSSPNENINGENTSNLTSDPQVKSDESSFNLNDVSEESGKGKYLLHAIASGGIGIALLGAAVLQTVSVFDRSSDF